jgi:hypothetical protein
MFKKLEHESNLSRNCMLSLVAAHDPVDRKSSRNPGNQ